MYLKRINLYKKYNPEESFENITQKLGIHAGNLTMANTSLANELEFLSFDQKQTSASKGRKLSISASNEKYNELLAKKLKTQSKIEVLKKKKDLEELRQIK